MGSEAGTVPAPASIAEDSILEGPYWPEPVRVIFVKAVGRRLQIHARGLQTRTAYDVTLLPEEIRDRVKVRRAEAQNFGGDPSKFRLALEAWRTRLAYEYDPHLAVSVSQIDPLPHQLEAVYQYLLPRARVRFLLADDPGAGKTIMAGLLLKELKLRGLCERALIVTPANLTDQWRREMKDKFGEVFEVVRRGSVESLYGRNIWDERPQCITSIDFAKPHEKDPIRNSTFDALKEARWDLVFVDEAHKMAAYIYGEKRKESDRYRLGKALSERSDHLVLLTATPHKGDPDNFRLLLQLLDRETFESPNSLPGALQDPGNPIFLRRVKEDMVYFPRPGEPKPRAIFPPRHVKTLAFRLSPAERELYEAVTHYVEEQSDRAARLGERGRLLGFTLALLQRRLASSTRAIRRSLERRLEKLQEARKRAAEPTTPPKLLEDPEDIEELTEEERWKLEAEWERLTVAQNAEELSWECTELGQLITLAKNVESTKTETKLKELHDLLKSEGFAGKERKLLIFTEHKDTLDHLLEALKEWGFSSTQIHGGMKLGDETLPGTRIWAEKHFKDPEGAQVMVATEAAGEGINLQFCSFMVNYDLPWNPNRLEQRMGRIHRYGQTHDVYVFNLVARDTREGDIMQLLLEKIEEIRQSMGNDRVYDVISEVLPGVRLDQMFREALARQIDWEDIPRFVEASLSVDKVKSLLKATQEGLATRHVDLQGVLDADRRSREQGLIPEYVERFFLEAFAALGGTGERRADGLVRIERVPHPIQQSTPDLKRKYGPVDRDYRKVTFRKEVLKRQADATFMGPGHALFESVVEQVLTNFSGELRRGAVFYHPDLAEPQTVSVYLARVQDGRGRIVGSRPFGVAQGERGEPRVVPLGILLDCVPGKVDGGSSPASAMSPDALLDWVYDHALQPYLEEIRVKRVRESEVAEVHVKASLSTLIAESVSKTMKYQRQAERGANMDAAIRQEEARRADLESRLKRRQQELALERHLVLTTPDLLGTALLLPHPSHAGGREMARDEQVEAAAMEAAMSFERAAGRVPLDVSAENLGFDLRSTSPGSQEVRYIEVKGRAAVGEVWLTPNEWTMAERMGPEYWLYAVFNATKRPEVRAVADPAHRLAAARREEVVRYVVTPEALERAAK